MDMESERNSTNFEELAQCLFCFLSRKWILSSRGEQAWTLRSTDALAIESFGSLKLDK